MAKFEEGNQFWKQRSKHGRDKIIESPQVMLDAVYEFLALKSESTIDKPELLKGGDAAGTQCNLTTKDYPTLAELAHFLGFKTLQSWYNYKERPDFLEVITHAEEIIKTWKIKGASVGAYNQSIVARDLGLADKKEVKKESKKTLVITKDLDGNYIGEEL